jgi:hypothetical protein
MATLDPKLPAQDKGCAPNLPVNAGISLANAQKRRLSVELGCSSNSALEDSLTSVRGATSNGILPVSVDLKTTATFVQSLSSSPIDEFTREELWETNKCAKARNEGVVDNVESTLDARELVPQEGQSDPASAQGLLDASIDEIDPVEWESIAAEGPDAIEGYDSRLLTAESGINDSGATRVDAAGAGSSCDAALSGCITTDRRILRATETGDEVLNSDDDLSPSEFQFALRSCGGMRETRDNRGWIAWANSQDERKQRGGLDREQVRRPSFRVSPPLMLALPHPAGPV